MYQYGISRDTVQLTKCGYSILDAVYCILYKTYRSPSSRAWSRWCWLRQSQSAAHVANPFAPFWI